MHRPQVLINRFSRLLGERRLSVAEVAQGSGVSRSSIHEIFHGRAKRIDLETLNKLCAFLDVTPADIFEYRRADNEPAAHPSSAEVVR